MKATPAYIATLNPDEIFVFGSNESGIHAGGAANQAVNAFGAIEGRGFGMQGQSFAIPTISKDIERVLSIVEIKKYVDWFISATQIPENEELQFLVTEIGCGVAGYLPSEIAPLFKKCKGLPNVTLPAIFMEVIDGLQ